MRSAVSDSHIHMIQGGEKEKKIVSIPILLHIHPSDHEKLDGLLLAVKILSDKQMNVIMITIRLVELLGKNERLYLDVQ